MKDEIRPDALIKVINTEPKDEGLKNIPVTPGNYRKFKGKSSNLPRGIFWGVTGLVVLFVGGFIVSFYAFRGKVIGLISGNIVTIRAGVEDLRNLDPKSAEAKFSSLQGMSGSDPGVLFDNLGSLFRGGGGAIASFADLGKQLALLSSQLASSESAAADFFVGGKGGALVGVLDGLRDTVSAIDADSNNLSSAASFVGGFSSLGAGDFYLSLKTQIEGAKKFLDAFVPWLSDPRTHHILVLLQNPSEIRPAGGFLGSYADVTLSGGDITDVSVHDVADVDGAFNKKVIPPKPLQLEVTRWRPADANWFFDFSASAYKTIAFFEASDLYAKTSTTFDGAIAISPKVVRDLLSLIGPISVGKPATTFTADNFLVQIQKIVQNGQSDSATYPKQIVKDLSGALLAKLSSSTDETAKQNILNMAFDWVSKKDVMAYFKDPAFEEFFNTYGASGAAYELPQKFNGDYLAVVDANIQGGKSDLYVSSTIALTSQINADGTLGNHLVITRKHNGNKSPYWWYKVTNQDYLQLFVPDGTTLANAAGGTEKKISAPIDYAKNGYSTDPMVVTIEATEQTLFGYPGINWHEEGGKRVFATWATVKSGESKQFSFDYSHRLFLPPADGVKYQFVFEKQAGTNRHYSYEINAPLGFVFAENRLPSFEYKSDDPPGRLIIDLTLEKLQ